MIPVTPDKNRKVNTFDKSMTREEAELEKRKGTVIGKALKKAEEHGH